MSEVAYRSWTARSWKKVRASVIELSKTSSIGYSDNRRDSHAVLLCLKSRESHLMRSVPPAVAGGSMTNRRDIAIDYELEWF